MRTLLRLACLGLVAILAGAILLVRFDRYGRFDAPVYVDIPRGTGSRAVGEKLARAGVIRFPLLYQAARVLGRGRGAQAGEYRFDHAATPAEVFHRLSNGDIYVIEVRVPEGATMFDIAAEVERAGLATAAAFLREARSPALIRDLAPAAPSLEGFLFPATYRFNRHARPHDICRAMTERFRQVWRELGAPADVIGTVTLASIVEKEAVLASERPRIAGVYATRRRIGMKLDCDPTVIYAAQLDHRWTGAIRREDLASDNPYNTYRHTGLPPGPIANPGRDSLQAALHPDLTGDLYFVAAPGATGAHVFSKDLATHGKAVASYRRDQRRRP
jgi:UPF0755 protein